MRVHPDEEAISAWLDGEAGPDEADILRHHLAGCVQCQEQLDSLAEVRVSLSALRNVTAPSTLKVRLLHDWESRWGRLNSRRPVGSFVLPWMPAVALGMILVLLIPQLRSRMSLMIDPHTPKGIGEAVANLPTSPTPEVTQGRVDLGDGAIPKGVEPDRPSLSAIGSVEASIAKVQKEVGLLQWASSNRPPQATPRATRPARRSPRKRLPERRIAPAAPAQPTVGLASANTPPTPIPSTSSAGDGTAEVQLASAITPVLELTIEETPNDPGPMHPRQASCVWMAKDTETGEVSGGSVVRSYSPNGDLQSVALHLPVTEKIAAAPAGDKEITTPKESDETDPTDTKDKINQIDSEETHESTDHRLDGSGGLYAGVVRSGSHPVPSI